MPPYEEDPQEPWAPVPGFTVRLLLLFFAGGISSYFVYGWISQMLGGHTGGPGWRVGLLATIGLILCIRALAGLLSS